MILFRLILKEYLKFVFGTVLLCLFLFTLFDFIHKTTNYYARYNPGASLIAKFYFYQLPFQLVQILPIASLLSSVIVMVLYNRSNEVTAMRAAGMSPTKIVAPLAAGGLLLSLLSYFLNEVIVPQSSHKMHFITHVLIEGDSVHATDEGAHWVRNGNTIFHFEEYEHSSQTLKNIKLVSIGKPFYPKDAIHASSAKFDPKTKLWDLYDIQQLSISLDGKISKYKPPKALRIRLPVEPDKLNIDRRIADEISISELAERIDLGAKRGADVLNLRIALHVKLAYPLAAFLISLLGLKFGYRSERTTETVRSILVAFAVGISYWFILSSARALAIAGDLPPFMAGWLANAVIGAIVMWQYLRVHRI
ncbi:MAG: YjgP/YjgQ family permease [Oligoflexales bacterium]|nr:YjgP/YjgQ family permease [Oligoflexales bacterium]